MAQLQTLYNLLKDNADEWTSALKADLGKHQIEATLTEVSTTALEVLEAVQNLEQWAASVPVDTAGIVAPVWCEIRKEPRGVALIISPFNYPVSLLLGPLISALAAGNTAVLKPSEMCPAVSSTAARLITRYFKPEIVSVVEGGIPQTTRLMELPWGLVFFTGSERVGKIIAGAAAKTLSPVVLELGGKAPCVVTEDCPELSAMCDRIVWGKSINCGQTCTAPDYLMVHESIIDTVTAGLCEALRHQFGENQKESSEFGRNVSQMHTQRLKDMLKEAEDAGCSILSGGSHP